MSSLSNGWRVAHGGAFSSIRVCAHTHEGNRKHVPHPPPATQRTTSLFAGTDKSGKLIDDAELERLHLAHADIAGEAP